MNFPVRICHSSPSVSLLNTNTISSQCVSGESKLLPCRDVGISANDPDSSEEGGSGAVCFPYDSMSRGLI
jgi:hypothetical protein